MKVGDRVRVLKDYAECANVLAGDRGTITGICGTGAKVTMDIPRCPDVIEWSFTSDSIELCASQDTPFEKEWTPGSIKVTRTTRGDGTVTGEWAAFRYNSTTERLYGGSDMTMGGTTPCPIQRPVKCECGTDKVGGGNHSSWCPKTNQ